MVRINNTQRTKSHNLIHSSTLFDSEFVDGMSEEDKLSIRRRIVCVKVPRGQNLFECTTADNMNSNPDNNLSDNNISDLNNTVLVQMPPKYRNFLWIKRGIADNTVTL